MTTQGHHLPRFPTVNGVTIFHDSPQPWCHHPLGFTMADSVIVSKNSP